MPNKSSKEQIDVKLRYSGAEVDDGSMSVEDFVQAVQGFSGVYGRLASSIGYTQQHKIRIVGIEKGSVNILLTVKQMVDAAGNNADGIQTLIAMSGGASAAGMAIVKGIGWLIKFIKHVKKKPYTTKVRDGGNVIIQNSENVKLEMPINIYNIYKNNEGSIKNDLYKITTPLEEGKIDEAGIEAWSDGETCQENISAQEKSYFDPKEEELTETKRVWVQGSFNSLTKSTHKGYFYLSDGSRVVYEFKSKNPENLHKFFLHKGLVKVKSTVHFDQNLKPIRLDVYDVEELQMEMNFAPEDSEG